MCMFFLFFSCFFSQFNYEFSLVRQVDYITLYSTVFQIELTE